MKEQDYMNIMGSIRGEFLEEAVSWDGAQQRRVRQIRRMTASFGAVAAALAVVVGLIAFHASKDKIDIANNDKDSSTSDDLEKGQNLYGGHGELHQVMASNYGLCYDDDYVYELGTKWSVRSGGRMIPMSDSEWPADLLFDGENLFRIHDNRIYETDSFGKETELMNLAEYQFPSENNAEWIMDVKKLSDRMLCISYHVGWGENNTILIADLKEKKLLTHPEGSDYVIPDQETSYYAFSNGVLKYFELKDGELSGITVWALDDTSYDYNNTVLKDRKLYLTARRFEVGKDEPDTVPERYLIVDIDTGVKEETILPLNEHVHAGTAKIRMVTGDDSFDVYRSTLDGDNEQQILSVPYSQYFDTAAYGNPEMSWAHTVYDSEDMVIVYLPDLTDDISQPTKHGEQAVMIDLHTGKAVYYGQNYDLSTPDDSSPAEAVSTTVVSGTAAAGTTGGTTASRAVTTAAQTTTAAKFTVAAGSNIFGGQGRLFALSRYLWRDDNEVYEIAQSGSRFTIGANGELKRAGTCCRKEGCRHDNESCPLFHYNKEGIRSNPNSTAYDGQNVNLVTGDVIMNNLFVQRGPGLYSINSETGEETLLFSMKPLDAYAVDENNLHIWSISAVRGAHDTDTGKYLLNCGVRLNENGDPSGGATFLILVDRNSGTQNLVGTLGPDGYDSDMIMWGEWRQDVAENGDLYVIQNGSTLVRFDTNLNRIGSYPIPVADDAKPCASAWCVVRGVMWYLNEKAQWCSFDLNTRAVQVVKEQTGITFHEQAAPECFCLENTGMFFAKNGTKLMMFRYDMANSEITDADCMSLLYSQNLTLYNGTFSGCDENVSDGSMKVFDFPTPAWMPGPF